MNCVAVIAGALLVAAGAQISIPMVPVPATLQTLAICLLGLALGPWRAALALTAYLALVLADLPVLSSLQQVGGSQFVRFPSAGYVVGFIPAAAFIGWFGGLDVRAGRIFAACILGHAIILACGVGVLAAWIGINDAFTKGVLPFIPGMIVKSAVATGLVYAWRAAKS